MCIFIEGDVFISSTFLRHSDCRFYRRNRFNLVLVNVLGINNHGQSIILAFGFLSTKTKENYIWLFSQIKSAWKKTPKTCISDDDESIQQGKYIDFGYFIYIGLSSNFKSTLLLCSWHVQRNLVSKFCYISKTNPELYKKITNLPFITNQANFEEIIDTLRSSNDIPKEQIQYLDKKLEKKINGQNVLQKKEFAGGVSTTSRVEGLHAVQKKYLTSSSTLNKVFYSFRTLEKQQIARFQEEFQGNLKTESIEGIESLKIFKEKFSLYIYRRIATKYKLAIDYIKVQEITHGILIFNFNSQYLKERILQRQRKGTFSCYKKK